MSAGQIDSSTAILTWSVKPSEHVAWRDKYLQKKNVNFGYNLIHINL